jgi:hypothetical protein
MTNHNRPREITLHGLRIVDVRHLFPVVTNRPLDPRDVRGTAVHHDGILMPPGDRNYNGSTLDEDLQRLRAVYDHAIDQGWGRFPYHLMASPNGRTFLTLDLNSRGAHVEGRNHELHGASLMGDFTTRQPGNPQVCAAAAAVVLCERHIAGTQAVKGHREWAIPTSPTACPGATWWQWQQRLWALVGAQLRRAS